MKYIKNILLIITISFVQSVKIVKNIILKDTSKNYDYGKKKVLDKKKFHIEKKIARNKERRKQYYKNNKKKLLDRQKEYNKNNKEKISFREKRYYIKYKAENPFYNRTRYLTKKKNLEKKKIILFNNNIDNKYIDKEKILNLITNISNDELNPKLNEEQNLNSSNIEYLLNNKDKLNIEKEINKYKERLKKKKEKDEEYIPKSYVKMKEKF